MTETAIPKPMTAGAIGRFTRDVDDLSTSGLRHYKGERFEVETHVDAEESEDGVPFYWGSRVGNIGGVCVPADAVEQAMTAREADARQLPTRAALLQEIAWGVSGPQRDFEIDTSEMHLDERDTVTLFGTTHDGLRFAAVVAIKTIEHSDWV